LKKFTAYDMKGVARWWQLITLFRDIVGKTFIFQGTTNSKALQLLSIKSCRNFSYVQRVWDYLLDKALHFLTFEHFSWISWQQSLKLGGTNYHFKWVKISGTTPYWKSLLCSISRPRSSLRVYWYIKGMVQGPNFILYLKT
jgi:hypothetical protein